MAGTKHATVAHLIVALIFQCWLVVEANIGTRVQLCGAEGDVSHLRSESRRVT
jgi:hypothetical protein